MSDKGGISVRANRRGRIAQSNYPMVHRGAGVRTEYLKPTTETRLEERMQLTYPTVCPIPLSFSTRMSKTRSPVTPSQFILHQLRRPMIYFCFRGEPFVSVENKGI